MAVKLKAVELVPEGAPLEGEVPPVPPAPIEIG